VKGRIRRRIEQTEIDEHESYTRRYHQNGCSKCSYVQYGRRGEGNGRSGEARFEEGVVLGWGLALKGDPARRVRNWMGVEKGRQRKKKNKGEASSVGIRTVRRGGWRT